MSQPEMTAPLSRSVVSLNSGGLFARLRRYASGVAYDLRNTMAFAADFPSAMQMGTDLATFRLLEVLWKPTDRIRRVRLKPDIRLSYRQNKGDIYSIHEIWFEESYRLPIDLKPAVLVDLGANIGMTSLWLARRYGCLRIIAVEPSAGNAAVARENFTRNGITAEVFEAAAGAEDGTAEFLVSTSSTNGRLAMGADSGGPSPRKESVRMVSMRTVLASLPPEMPVDLMKVDIEGGEQDLLMGDTSWLKRVNALFIEFHPALIEYDRLVGIIEAHGLKRAHSVLTDPGGVNTLELFVRS